MSSKKDIEANLSQDSVIGMLSGDSSTQQVFAPPEVVVDQGDLYHEDKSSRCKACFRRCLSMPRSRLLELLMVLVWYCVLWLILGGGMVLPGGVIFTLLLLFCGSILGGRLMVPVGLPPLLGMLLIGFGTRNVSEWLGSGMFIVDTEWSFILRSIALTVILTRAGLGLDLHALKRLKASVVRLAFLPNIAEAALDAYFAVAIFEMSWPIAIALGFVLSAVSPAVVVPSLLKLQDQRYGTKKGIPTLVLAAASFDDVLSISAFSICVGLAFSSGDSNLWFNIFRAPLEIIMGVGLGILLGSVCGWLVPSSGLSSPPPSPQAPFARVALLIGGGMCAVIGGARAHFSGAGALCVIVAGFKAAQQWHYTDLCVVKDSFKAMWVSVAQPFLFVLIGASVSYTFLDLRFIVNGLQILFIGLAVRLVISILCVWTSDFTLRERVFIALSWLPKATVQAALGSVVLDTAVARPGGSIEQEVLWGQQILTLAVLAILVTAPIGAVAIAVGGPRLLTQETEAAFRARMQGNNGLNSSISSGLNGSTQIELPNSDPDVSNEATMQSTDHKE